MSTAKVNAELPTSAPAELSETALDQAVGGGIAFVGGWGSSAYQYATTNVHPSSGHSGGINVALGDGSVRGVRY